MNDLVHTCRRIRPEVEGETRKYPARPVRDHADSKGRGNLPGVPPAWQARHEARLLAEQARVQAELAHHPEEVPHQHARTQRLADRRILAVHLAGQGGRAPRRWLRADLGWDSLRLEAAIKFTAWFVRERAYLRLTPAGVAAANEEVRS